MTWLVNEGLAKDGTDKGLNKQALDKDAYLQSAANALYTRMSPDVILRYRELLDRNRKSAQKLLKKKEGLHRVLWFLRQLMEMEPETAVEQCKDCHPGSEADILCFLLIARFVLATERAAKNDDWELPSMVRMNEQQMAAFCLVHLMCGRQKVCEKLMADLFSEIQD